MSRFFAWVARKAKRPPLDQDSSHEEASQVQEILGEATMENEEILEEDLEEAKQLYVHVALVYDESDSEKADQITEILDKFVMYPIFHVNNSATAPTIDEQVAERFDVIIVLVSRMMQAHASNHSGFLVLCEEKSNALLPVVIEEEMLLQKSWQREISWYLSNELYIDFSSDSLKEALLQRNIEGKTKGQYPNKDWDVFLSHEWGENQSTHKKAVEIGQALERDYGLKVWIDDKYMNGSVDSAMTNGIEGSKIFLILATKKYMEKVNSRDRYDHCLKEFLHGTNIRFDRTVVAALEPDMLNKETFWTSDFKLALSNLVPTNLTEITQSNLEVLSSNIRMRMAHRAPAGRLTPHLRDLEPILAPYASDNNLFVKSQAEKFTQGTRSWIFNKLSDWYSDKDRIFFLEGDGGVGKSVVMAEICRRGGAMGLCETPEDENMARQRLSNVRKLWRKTNNRRSPVSVAACHFFRHDNTIENRASGALINVCWQLCLLFPEFAQALQVPPNLSLIDEPLTNLFKILLVKPSQGVQSSQRHVVVLDALDECSEAERLLDEIIVQRWAQELPPWLCLAVSSRPENAIPSFVRDFHPSKLSLEDERNIHDIRAHFQHMLTGMAESELIETSAINESADILTERSEGLFLWASFLPDTLNEIHRDLQNPLTVTDILAEDRFPVGLSGMFKKYFKRLRKTLATDNNYSKLLAPIVAAREPLRVEVIQELLGIHSQREMHLLIGKARNLLTQTGNGSIGLVHKRMADWLTDYEVSYDLSVEPIEGHEALANYCQANDTTFAYQHLIYHLVQANRRSEAIQALDYFPWIQRAIRVGGDTPEERKAFMAVLIRDFNELSILYESDGARLMSKKISEFSKYPEELSSQVLSRIDENENRPLRNTLIKPNQPSLDPFKLSLPDPQSPLLRVLEGHEEQVTSVAVDGQLVASGSEDTTLCIWDAVTGQQIFALTGHNDPILCVALAGYYAVSGSGPLYKQDMREDSDCTVRLWNVRTGQLKSIFSGHTDAVTSVAIQGEYILSGSKDMTLRLWACDDTNSSLSVFNDIGSPVLSVALYEKTVACGCYDSMVHVWNLEKPETKVHIFKGHSDSVNSVSIDGDTLVSGSDDAIVCICDLETGAIIHSLEHPLSVTGVSLKNDQLISGCWDKSIRIWDINTGEALHQFKGHSSAINSVSSDGRWIVSGSDDATVRIWDASNDLQAHSRESHRYAVSCLAVDNDIVVTGSRDESINVWNLNTGKQLYEMQGHEGWILDIAIENNLVVSGGSWDRTVRVWDIDNGEQLHILEGHTDNVASVTIQDGLIASASLDKTIRLWDSVSGELLRILEGHTDGVNSVALQNTTYAVSGSNDLTVRVWDVESGDELNALLGHTTAVTCVTVQNDIVASGSADQTLRVWDLLSGSMLHVLRNPYSEPKAFARILFDLKVISARDISGRVVTWDLENQKSLSNREFVDSSASLFPFNEAHVGFDNLAGFSPDENVSQCLRSGDVLIVGDDGGGVHFLKFCGL